MTVDVQMASVQPGLPKQAEWVRWAESALEHDRRDFDLTVRIVDHHEGLALNRDYRGGKSATNVLSFPFEPPRGVSLNLLGDVVICAPVVLREAAEQGKSVHAHCAHLVIHGVLHLQGYDHSKNDTARVMESRELSLLRDLGFSDPYRLPNSEEDALAVNPEHRATNHANRHSERVR